MNEWREIPGFDGWYLMNREGRIMSLRRRGYQKDRKCTPHEIYGAKSHITLCKDGTDRTYTKRQLLCMTFPEEHHRSAHGEKVPVQKVDAEGRVVSCYKSKMDAARANFISRMGLDYHIESGKAIHLADGAFTFREVPFDRFLMEDS